MEYYSDKKTNWGRLSCSDMERSSKYIIKYKNYTSQKLHKHTFRQHDFSYSNKKRCLYKSMFINVTVRTFWKGVAKIDAVQRGMKDSFPCYSVC